MVIKLIRRVREQISENKQLFAVFVYVINASDISYFSRENVKRVEYAPCIIAYIMLCIRKIVHHYSKRPFM